VIFWLSSLVDLELQLYSFALACFVGKPWWIGPLCSFSSLGTVSIVRCPTCHYWAFRFIPFPLTQLRVLITLWVFAPSIIRSTIASPTGPSPATTFAVAGPCFTLPLPTLSIGPSRIPFEASGKVRTCVYSFNPDCTLTLNLRHTPPLPPTRH
jgi:hypothetical protein